MSSTDADVVNLQTRFFLLLQIIFLNLFEFLIMMNELRFTFNYDECTRLKEEVLVEEEVGAQRKESQKEIPTPGKDNLMHRSSTV